jgi:hypothetical protein
VISHERKQQIVAAFQQNFKRDNSAEIETIRLDELRDADAMLGERDLNAGYRIAMRNRITDLDLLEERQYDSKVRAWNYIMGVITGLVIAAVAASIF